VILLHGIYCNAASWWWMRRRLVSRRIGPVYTLDVESPLSSIDSYAQQLARFIEQVRAATGAERVVLVGHSMGGLVARACIALPGLASQVVKLLTLGTPHHGSRHACLGIGANSHQLETDSDWLCRLNANPDSMAVPIVSIYSRHDNLVAPQESAVLPGAKLIALDGVGHLSLLFDRVVAKLLCDAIEEAEPGVTRLAARSAREASNELAAVEYP
jgi:predicted alpha/beta hydrolase family esterase